MATRLQRSAAVELKVLLEARALKRSLAEALRGGM